MLNRTLQAELERILGTTSKSVVLLGPRQTGKSTLLRSLRPTAVIDLADESTFRDHVKDPALLRARCEALPRHARVLIDEIQRLPDLLNTVQSLIDQRRDLLFLITGSSARKLRRGRANLLPGRTFWFNLHPLTYWELTERWDLTKALTIGTLPEVYLNDYGPELLSHYAATYLREEIAAEALTRNVGSYARFLDIAAENSGRITNYSQLASDSEIPKETIRRFYDILADTLLVHRLPWFEGGASARKAKQKETFLFFDLGVRNAILRQHRNVFTPSEMGKLFEQWFIGQILAFIEYQRKDWRCFFYRDERQNEVDLIVDMGNRLLAIEIKYGTSFKTEYTNGLLAFQVAKPTPVRRILIYRGEHSQIRDGVEVIPYREFLDETIFGL